MRANTAATLASRLRANGECLEYIGQRHRGYGQIWVQGRVWRAHRLAWTLANGPIPDGLHVLHSCDNPPCCRLEHLRLGTHVDNMRDLMDHGRSVLRRQAGERNPAAKVTAAQVVEIRRLASAGHSRRALGRQFGLSNQTITRIVLRQRWKTVA